MNRLFSVLLATLIAGTVMFPATARSDDPAFQWNTFSGSAATDNSFSVAFDSSGNVYQCGSSTANWGTPLNANTQGNDISVTKYDADGNVVWNTFLGGAGTEECYDIAVDSSGNVFVAGYGTETWGTPVQAFTGGYEMVVAKLNSAGTLQWNTFAGGATSDKAYGVTLDSGGNPYVTGHSDATWGTPVNTWPGGSDKKIAVAKFSSADGSLVWNTFFGATTSTTNGEAQGESIALDSDANVYVTGVSEATWAGTGAAAPLNAYTGTGANDIAVLKLNSGGAYQWHSFYGSTSADFGYSIVAQSNTDIIIAGTTFAAWNGPGAVPPLNAHAGSGDIAILKLNAAGAYQWHTFHGSTAFESGESVALDTTNNIYFIGRGSATWGNPVTPHAGGHDMTLGRLDTAGALTWNTFAGGTGSDFGYSVAVDANDHVYGAGRSSATWGSPVAPYAGDSDMAVIKYETPAAPTNFLVSSIIPAKAATSVALDTTIMLTFAAAANRTSVKNGFSMSPITDQDYTISWSSDNRTMTLALKTKLAASTRYNIILGKTVKSATGTALGTAYSSYFTTKAESAADVAARAGTAPRRTEIQATLNNGGISTSAAQSMVNDGIVLIPDGINQEGTRGAASGSETDKAEAAFDAAHFAASVAEANKPAGFDPAATVAGVKGLVANATSSTSTSPKVIALYALGYLAKGAFTFPKCFKANENTASILEFTYVNALTSDKINSAADGDGKAGFALMNPSTGAVIRQTDPLPVLAGGYQLVLFIRDNSLFDQDSNFGCVKDPSYLTSATSTTTTSSSSNGCMMNPTAGFGLEWLMLLLAPFIMAVRNRFEK